MASISEFFDQNWLLDEATGCWEWTRTKIRTGYGRLRADGKRMLAHRYSYVRANGPIPDGLCVLHRCDNPSCVNPDHLFLGTQQDNMRDRDRKGRRAPTHGTKLTATDAERIRDMRQLGVTGKEIASHFHISRSNVSAIANGITWRSHGIN